MERIELVPYGDQIRIYIDQQLVTCVGLGTRTSHGYGYDGRGEASEVPCVRIVHPYAHHDGKAADGPTTFVDVPRGPRAEAAAWRDKMLCELRSILGPERDFSSFGSGYRNDPERAALERALRDGAHAFGGHFTAFFEILHEWIASGPIGDVRADTEIETSPLAPGEPPPGVLP